MPQNEKGLQMWKGTGHATTNAMNFGAYLQRDLISLINCIHDNPM